MQPGPRFEIFRDSAGKYRFRLKSAAGEVIAASQAYETVAGARNGIDSVTRHAADSRVVDLTGEA